MFDAIANLACRNDRWWFPGAERGGCPDLGMDPDLELPAWVRVELGIRDDVTQALAGASPACARCTGSLPGCCWQTVKTTFFEAALITNLYSGVLEARADVFGTRAAEELAWFGAKRATKTVGDYLELAAGWHLRGKACPFLTAEGRCAIWKARPYACVINAVRHEDDPAACGPHEDGPRVVGYLRAPGLATQLLGRALDASRRNGMPPHAYVGLSAALVETQRWIRVTEN